MRAYSHATMGSVFYMRCIPMMPSALARRRILRNNKLKVKRHALKSLKDKFK